MRSLVVIGLILASLPATAQMTHEETVVRTAYAKFAYAVQQEAIGELAMEAQSEGAPVPERFAGLTSAQRLADAQVRFVLSDFAIGNIRDILRLKVLDLMTSEVGEELATTNVTESFDDRGFTTQWYGLQAAWQPAADPNPPEAAMLTIDQLYQLQWKQLRPDTAWQRYATYSVTVRYQGKSRGPYKALFVFGHDEKGNEVIEPEDAVVSVTGLAFVLSEPLFPEAFVRTRLRNFPVVSNWLNANLVSRHACSIGKGDVCCGLTKPKCGPGEDDVAAGFIKPLPHDSPSGEQNGKPEENL